MLDAALHDALTADAAVAAEIGTRAYPQVAPEGADYPMITYFQVAPGVEETRNVSGPVAHFMYQCKQGTRVTLYVRNEAATNRETAFLYSQEGKVRVVYWMDRKLGYAVSSGDISKETLLNVANAAYQQLNPP